MKRAGIGRAGLIAIAVASLGACAGGVEAPLVSTAGMPGALEPVHAAAFTRNEAIFWVSSNGCTRKADLLPVVRRHGDASVITLRRLKEDRCLEPRDQGVEMRWTFQEMGLAPGTRVSIENPYQLSRAAG